MTPPKDTARSRAAVPKRIRETAGPYAGEVLAIETDGDRVVVRRTAPDPDDYLEGLAAAMNEWLSPQDEEAWRDL